MTVREAIYRLKRFPMGATLTTRSRSRERGSFVKAILPKAMDGKPLPSGKASEAFFVRIVGAEG